MDKSRTTQGKCVINRAFQNDENEGYSIIMESIIVQRLKERMHEMDKNPSGLALEAKLGRSAVRDILSGRAKNPQYATLLNLASALNCSVSYLTGEIDTLFKLPEGNRLEDFEPEAKDIVAVLEAGVYRHQSFDENPFANPIMPYKDEVEEHLVYNDLRLDGHSYDLYQVADSSLSGRGVLPGDVLHVAIHRDGASPVLKDGMLVVVKYEPHQLGAYELSARFVKIEGDDVRLETASVGQGHKVLSISSNQFQTKRGVVYKGYLLTNGDRVWIEGVVVRVVRSMPVVM